jgi:hypothetical protein
VHYANKLLREIHEKMRKDEEERLYNANVGKVRDILTQ